jgi:hypothetical protein
MRRWGRCLIAASALALMLTLIGCTLNPSRADVLGRYELKGIGAGGITLALRGDGTFSENISWPSKREDHRSGIWTLSGGSVTLSELWIPGEFAPDYITDADTISDGDKQNSAPMPKYTEPGNWSLSAEKRWGVVLLTVFPDADIEFKKIRGT